MNLHPVSYYQSTRSFFTQTHQSNWTRDFVNYDITVKFVALPPLISLTHHLNYSHCPYTHLPKTESLKPIMTKRSETLVESREELMISASGEGNPTKRKAHFLHPSINSIKEPIFDIPSHTLSSLPPTFDPKNWLFSVSFNGWRYPAKKWKAWVEKMASLHQSTWKKAGIYDAILNSTCEIIRSDYLIFGVAERWCPETKSFIFPWGEATITLEDMLVAGYSVLGFPVFSSLEAEELKAIEQKLENARVEITRTSAKKATIQSWQSKFMDSGSEIEHEAFLAFWLSRCVFPNTHDSIRKPVFTIAVHLARGTKIALAPAVLARIYRDLSLLKEKIVESIMLGSKKNDDGVLTVKLWSPFQLVQIWAWERFLELRPEPNLLKIGEPRLARWDKLKHKVENVRLVLDSAKESFSWRPYAQNVKNWDLAKFYRQVEKWVPIDTDFDEELMAFALCMRVSTLVGLDSTEQYLPHRVAMQFGIDQDLPGCGSQSIMSPESAFADYSRRVSEAKFYVPSRNFAAEVTTRYKEWWKKSMEGLQHVKNCSVQQRKSSKGSRMALKNLKGKKKGSNFVSSFKIAQKISKEKKASKSSMRSKIAAKSGRRRKASARISSFRISPKIPNATSDGDTFISSFKITPKAPKRKNNASNALAAFCNSSKQLKVSAKSPRRMKELNEVFSSSAFQLESSKEWGGSSKPTAEGKHATLSHGSSFNIVTKSVPSSEGSNKGVYKECASEKSAPSLKRKKEDRSDCPVCPSKTRKTSPLSFDALKEINSFPVPPGFAPKIDGVEATDCIEEDDMPIAKILKCRGKREGFEIGQGEECIEEDDMPIAKILKCRGNREGFENVQREDFVKSSQGEDYVKSSGQSRNLLGTITRNGAVEPVEPVTASVGNVVQSEDVDIQQAGDGEKSSGESQNYSSSCADNGVLKNMKLVTAVDKEAKQDEAGPSRSHNSSIGDNAAPKNLKPATPLVEKAKSSDAKMGGSQRAVEDANQSSAGSPTHGTLSINSTGEGSSCRVAMQCLELGARIDRLEKMMAEIKAARRNLST